MYLFKRELAGKNRFSTGTLNYSNIANHANYKGSAFGASGGISANFETPLGDKGIAQSNKRVKDENGNQVLATGAESLQAGMNLGYGSDSDSQSSQTKSGINTQNIIIRDEQSQLAKTGKTVEQIKAEIKTDITTDTAEKRSGKLDNNFDKAKLEKELDYQVKATKEFDQNRKEVTSYLYSKAEEKRVEATKIRRNTEIDGKTGYNKEESLELERKADIYDAIAFGTDLALGVAYGWGNNTLLSYAGTGAVTTPVVNAATAPEQIWEVKCRQDSLYCSDTNLDGSDRPKEEGKAQIGDKRQIFDINEIKPSPTSGVITLSNNGILNSLDDALKNAVKQNKWATSKDGVVVIYNRPTGNYVSELLYAAYDKINDLIGGRLPLTTAEKANLKLYDYAKQNNYALDVSSHSRGGLTASVAIQKANRIGLKDIPIRESRFIGTATNVKDYAGYLKENNQNAVTKSAVHKADFIGNKWNLGLMGFNEVTGGDCISCYSHSSYFGERPSEYLIDEKGQYIDLKGNMVDETSRVRNEYYNEFNKIWSSNKEDNPSLPKVINGEGK